MVIVVLSVGIRSLMSSRRTVRAFVEGSVVTEVGVRAPSGLLAETYVTVLFLPSILSGFEVNVSVTERLKPLVVPVLVTVIRVLACPPSSTLPLDLETERVGAALALPAQTSETAIAIRSVRVKQAVTARQWLERRNTETSSYPRLIKRSATHQQVYPRIS
jgi:hypothetical protein